MARLLSERSAGSLNIVAISFFYLLTLRHLSSLSNFYSLYNHIAKKLVGFDGGGGDGGSGSRSCVCVCVRTRAFVCVSLRLPDCYWHWSFEI